jgi:hypothetical protein
LLSLLPELSKEKAPQEAGVKAATRITEVADKPNNIRIDNNILRACRQDSGEGSPREEKREAPREDRKSVV